MLNSVYLLVNSCSKDRIGRGFRIAFWPVTRNGPTTLIPNHRGSVSNANDVFEPNIEGETATVPRETRQSYSPAWQCSATCRNTDQDILGNAEMGGLTPPAVLSRRCSFRLPFVSINRTRPGSSAFPLSWRSQKMDWFVNRLKRRIVFSRWYPTIARKMEKIIGSIT